MKNEIATVGVNTSQMSITSIITTSKAAHIFSHTDDFSALYHRLSTEGVPFEWEQFADYSPLTFKEADDALEARYPELTPINRVYESELERSAFIN